MCCRAVWSNPGNHGQGSGQEHHATHHEGFILNALKNRARQQVQGVYQECRNIRSNVYERRLGARLGKFVKSLAKCQALFFIRCKWYISRCDKASSTFVRVLDHVQQRQHGSPVAAAGGHTKLLFNPGCRFRSAHAVRPFLYKALHINATAALV